MKRGRTPTRFNSTDLQTLTQPAAARQPTPCAAASSLAKTLPATSLAPAQPILLSLSQILYSPPARTAVLHICPRPR